MHTASRTIASGSSHWTEVLWRLLRSADALFDRTAVMAFVALQRDAQLLCCKESLKTQDSTIRCMCFMLDMTKHFVLLPIDGSKLV